MSTEVYTHAMWKVRAGEEERFIEEWMALAEVFSGLPAPPLHGTLIRSTEDPSVFYSFGPWRSAEDIEAMRGDAKAQEAFQSLLALCENATPGSYAVVRHVEVPARED